MVDSKPISSDIVKKSCEAIRVSYLKQLTDLLIQGCLFFGVSFVRYNVDTSLNIIDQTLLPFEEDVKKTED